MSTMVVYLQEKHQKYNQPVMSLYSYNFILVDITANIHHSYGSTNSAGSPIRLETYCRSL